MPWTTSDVDRFKSGLTQAQKRQWVQIANSALRRCQENNGTNCEAQAIRQANGSVGNNMVQNTQTAKKDELQQNHYTQTLRAQTRHYTPEVRMHQGRKHLVVPVVMMVEGVHHGSHGPVLHTADDLSRYPACWNGIPIAIFHPEDETGANVSANSPDIIESQAVGRVYNTHFLDGRLRAEAWLDEENMGRVSPEALQAVRDGKPIDVSVGVFTDDEPIQGLWNNEEYVAVSRNHRPDHLAILPGAEGACSWADGCGIRANQRKGGEDLTLLTQEGRPNVADPEGLKSLKELASNGFGLITTNEQGYRQLTNNIQQKLDRMDTDTRIHFLEEVYDDFFVYRVESREGSDPGTLYKRSYIVNEDGTTLEFGDDPVQVTRRVEYVEQPQQMQSGKRFKRTKTKGGEDIMANDNTNNKDTKPCCPEKVELLVQSAKAGFGEDDREWLQGLEEPQIDKLLTMNKELEKEPETKKPEGEDPQMNKEQAVQVLKDELSDISKFKSLVPNEIKAQLDYGERLHQEHRQDLVQHVMTNAAEGVYTEDELKEMETGSLEKLAKAIKPKVDYSAFGGSGNQPQTDAAQEEVLLPPGVQAE